MPRHPLPVSFLSLKIEQSSCTHLLFHLLYAKPTRRSSRIDEIEMFWTAYPPFSERRETVIGWQCLPSSPSPRRNDRWSRSLSCHLYIMVWCPYSQKLWSHQGKAVRFLLTFIRGGFHLQQEHILECPSLGGSYAHKLVTDGVMDIGKFFHRKRMCLLMVSRIRQAETESSKVRHLDILSARCSIDKSLSDFILERNTFCASNASLASWKDSSLAFLNRMPAKEWQVWWQTTWTYVFYHQSMICENLKCKVVCTSPSIGFLPQIW